MWKSHVTPSGISSTYAEFGGAERRAKTHQGTLNVPPIFPRFSRGKRISDCGIFAHAATQDVGCSIQIQRHGWQADSSGQASDQLLGLFPCARQTRRVLSWQPRAGNHFSGNCVICYTKKAALDLLVGKIK